MKIRIEGCTQEQFGEQGYDLTVGKVYPVREIQSGCYVISDDAGDEVWALMRGECAFLPRNARWVEVSE